MIVRPKFEIGCNCKYIGFSNTSLRYGAEVQIIYSYSNIFGGFSYLVKDEHKLGYHVREEDLDICA